jgi:hypothetical protein
MLAEAQITCPVCEGTGYDAGETDRICCGKSRAMSAVIYANGDQEWYLNEQWHRTDGPAIIWSDGSRAWWLHGQPFTEANWRQQVEAKQLV